MRGARLAAAEDEADDPSGPGDLGGAGGLGAPGDLDGAGPLGGGSEQRRPWSALRGRAAGWWFLLGVVLAVIAANALLASWSTKSRPHEVGSGSGPAPQPESRQGVSVAQREFGLLSGGGWAQAWELWSSTARSTLSQADFVRVNTECRPALGVPYVIDSTALVGSTTVSVAWHQASTTGTSSVVYEDGAWRFVPDATTLADYRRGADRLISEGKAAGRCH